MSTIFKKFLFRLLQMLWSQRFPKHIEVDLEHKHVQNCTVLAHRLELLNRLPKGSIVAELGVEHGLFSKEILERCQPAELVLVDTWPDVRIKETCIANTQMSDNVFLQQTTSVIYLKTQSENSLDWVYIDTDHTYKTTKEELEAAAKAVKPGGFICGHDYTSISYSGLRRYGVVEAVNEFCVQYGYEFIYLTSETTRHVSYALRKL
jgi:predicted O-methyltransferase YrrM